MLLFATHVWLQLIVLISAVGHGQSEGIRTDITNFDFYVQDILAQIEKMKEQYPSLPLFLFGHSMVCLLPLHFLCVEVSYYHVFVCACRGVLYPVEQQSTNRVCFLV